MEHKENYHICDILKNTTKTDNHGLIAMFAK